MSIGNVAGHQAVLNDVNTQLADADSLQQVYGIAEAFSKQLSYRYFQYSLLIPVSLHSPDYLHMNNLPAPWWTEYCENNLIQKDPVYRYCMQEGLPLAWQDAACYLKNASDIQVMHQASQYGIYDGVSLPVHSSLKRSGVLSFVLSDDTDRGMFQARHQSTMPYLSLFAVYMQAAIDRILALQVPRETEKLSGREKECIFWSAEGKTTGETADILGISPNTVTFHMRNIMRKLDVCNRQQAIARVILLGIIRPHAMPIVNRAQSHIVI